MFKVLRIFILLLILGTVIQQTFLDKADLDWKDNFYVAVYPINADNSTEVGAYIKTLTRDDFEPVAEYFAEEGARYHLGKRLHKNYLSNLNRLYPKKFAEQLYPK